MKRSGQPQIANPITLPRNTLQGNQLENNYAF